MKFAFVLGREPALSTAEILASFKASGREIDPRKAVFSASVLMVETETPVGPDFFDRLGGSIKMAEILSEAASPIEDAAGYLTAAGRKNADFGFSAYALSPKSEGLYKQTVRGLQKTALETKSRLRAAGLSARAVIGDGPALTAVQVDKNRLIEKGAEFILLVDAPKIILARTLAVQAYEEFSERDYGRPGRDAKSGMLPPKLARIMINLTAAGTGGMLLDPFCGSGTILTEAALLGFRRLSGSDISDKAVEDARRNFEWTMTKAGLEAPPPKFSVFDVKFLAEKFEKGSVDAIVTEPYLGPPLTGRESDQKIHFSYLELMGLYRRAFAGFAKVLKPGGAVVFVFPVFGNKHANILRELEELGFFAEGLLPGRAVEALGVKSSTGLTYRRPDQKVGREIFRFRFKAK